MAEKIAEKLGALDEVASAEIAGPGFINLRLNDSTWRAELAAVHADGDDYGRSDMGKGVRVNVEYVSAHPTLPMHLGHCRGEVGGDALETLLEYDVPDVIPAQFNNHAGSQVAVLDRQANMLFQKGCGNGDGQIPE